MPSKTYKIFLHTFKNIKSISWIALGLGVFAILIIVFSPKLHKKIPGPLTAIIICTLLNFLLPVQATTLGDIYGTVTVKIGVSFGFFNINKILPLLSPAITIAFLAGVVSLLSAAVADNLMGIKHNPNTELVGQGVANVVSSIFGGLPVAGAVARTSVNVENGAKSPIAAIMHSAFLLVFSLFLMPYTKHIPMTVFAAILIVVCYNMLNVKVIAKILKTSPMDIALMSLTFALAVIFDLMIAILSCTLLSLAYQLYKKLVKKKKGSSERTTGGIKLKGSISYLNYNKVLQEVHGEIYGMSDDVIIVDLGEVVDIDATFTDFLIRKTKKKRIKVVCSNSNICSKLAKHQELSYLLENKQQI